MIDKPEVSVVMGVYNGGDSLSRTLESVLSQQGVDLEFIVVNDGSTDNTLSILNDYSEKDNRLRVLDQENSGLTRSLIRGCAEARGEFIARQDAGDISLPGRLRKQLDLIQKSPDVVLVSCWYQLLGPKGEIISEVKPDLDSDIFINNLKNADTDSLQGPYHGTVMFYRPAYEKAGGYRESFYYAQDLDLWTRLIQEGTLMNVKEILYQARISYDSITAINIDKQHQLRRLIIQATRLRKQGESDKDILQYAEKIQPAAFSNNEEKIRANIAYFIGSCLANNNNPLAITYFREAIKSDFLHLKAWIKLLKLTLVNYINPS